MKRLWILLLALILCTACTPAAPSPAMYVEPAQLNQDEEAIAKLLGANTEQLIYDFKVDETVQSFYLTVYHLEDGAWTVFNGGGGYAWSGKEGRLALDFDVIPNGMRVALQHGDQFSATSHTASEPMDTENTSRSTSRLSSRTALVYEQEVPLVLQTYTDRMEHRSYSPESFFTPEVYAEGGFTDVYAITIMFSQTQLQ